MDPTPQHRKSLELIAQLQRSIDADSYHLTLEERDSLFYELENFKKRLNGIYAKRTACDGK